MKSKLSLPEFKAQLTACVKEGHPKLKFYTLGWLSLFSRAVKPLYGLYNQRSFNLTSNLKSNQLLFRIQGNYTLVNGTVQVAFTIEPRYKYQKLWWIFNTTLALGGLLYVAAKENDASKQETVLRVAIGYCVLVSLAIANLAWGKRQLKKQFVKLFELY